MHDSTDEIYTKISSQISFLDFVEGGRAPFFDENIHYFPTKKGLFPLPLNLKTLIIFLYKFHQSGVMHPSATCLHPCVVLCHELRHQRNQQVNSAVLNPLGSIWKASSIHIRCEDQASSQRACNMNGKIK